MNDQKRIDDIIAMLDGCVQNGIGHINLEVNASNDENDAIKVETFQSKDCSGTNQACSVPTLQTSIDKE